MGGLVEKNNNNMAFQKWNSNGMFGRKRIDNIEAFEKWNINGPFKKKITEMFSGNDGAQLNFKWRHLEYWKKIYLFCIIYFVIVKQWVKVKTQNESVEGLNFG